MTGTRCPSCLWTSATFDPRRPGGDRCPNCNTIVELKDGVLQMRPSLDPPRWQEVFQSILYERAKKSWAFVDKTERQMRLHAVIDLAAELSAIKKVSSFATRLGECVIEEIIQGDWDEALLLAEIFTFADEPELTRARYAPLWEKFVATTRAAHGRARLTEGPHPPS